MKLSSELNNLFFEKLTTARTLMLGYFIFILIGSTILMLPLSNADINGLSFVDAVFTTTSAISGTGLIVVDTASHFSFFGQMVIMTLIQIGNIGYMLFIALAMIFLGGRLSMLNKVIIRESISTSKMDIFMFIRKVFKYTLIIEGITAVLLTAYWTGNYGFGTALKQGVFHSISAFCTAGFSLFSNNMIVHSSDYFVNIVLIVTSYAGCCGFFVLYDVSTFSKKIFFKKNKYYRLSAHTKLVLTVSLSIIIFGSLIVLFSESLNKNSQTPDIFLTSFFQASSASTSVGFNSVNINMLNNSTLFALILMMFIGASPGGTGGGIKTTVFALMILTMLSFAVEKKRVNIFKRTVVPKDIARAFSVMLMALIWIFISVFILSVTEDQVFIHILFEAVSALGNNGISSGFTPELSSIGKLILSFSMLLGRVGPLIITYAVIGKKRSEFYMYPDANILIV